jgi:hypothetical protein
LVTVGPNNGSSFTNDATLGTIDWVNPGNAQTSNNIYATVVLPNFYDVSHYLKALGFGFSIPSDSVILGIMLTVECHSNVSDGTVMFYSIRLVKGGVISGQDKSTGQMIRDGVNDWTYQLGGATDLWGLSWTPADINASTFGAVISVVQQASASRNVSVDWMAITVYYEHLVAVTDSGSLVSETISTTATIPVSDGGAATETILSPLTKTFTDSGAGKEAPVDILASVPVSDGGVASEVPTIGIPIQDEGHLVSETVDLSALVPFTEEAIGVDIGFSSQGVLTLDGETFPQVISVRIIEPTGIDEFLPTGSPELPIRRQTGKYGRTVVVSGQVALSGVEALKALADGEDHFMMLPTGDGFFCHVNPVTVRIKPETRMDVDYSLELLERIDL